MHCTQSGFMQHPAKIEGELVDETTRHKWGLEPKPVMLPKRGPRSFQHPESLMKVRQAVRRRLRRPRLMAWFGSAATAWRE